MRRAAACAALALAACTTADRPNPGVRFAGSWDGLSYTAGSDTPHTWRSFLSVAQDGALTGSLRYGDRTEAIPLTTVALTDSLLVQELGPYRSQALGADVVTTLTGRLRGDSLLGEYVVQPVGGGEPYAGNFVAVRRPPPVP
jgi:hypothetical protein